jgi:hypothetical protein
MSGAMEMSFTRTRLSSLEDDEVILCDALFERPCLMRLLIAENAPEILNFPYWLSDSGRGAEAIAASMSARGLVRISTGDEGTLSEVVELTEDGGRLWEAERKARWEAHVTSIRKAGVRTIGVVAADEALARRYLSVGHDVGLFRLADGDAEIERSADAFIARPWKRGPQVTVTMRLVGERDEWIRPDWSAYEQQRTWWTSVAELLVSQRVSEVPLPGRHVLPPPLR